MFFCLSGYDKQEYVESKMKEIDLKISVSNKEFLKSCGKMMIACLVFLRFFIKRIPSVIAQCVKLNFLRFRFLKWIQKKKSWDLF